MFPFKVQLFQGCKSETERINTKSVVQHVIRYQVLLAAYYKADTSIVAVVQHVCQVTLSSLLHTYTNRLCKIPSIVGGILQSVLNEIQYVKVLRGIKMAEPCE
jgi:hypothetical protein